MENRHLNRLVNHLEERDWTDRDIKPLVRMIGHNAITSFQTSLAILEYQQAIDERIEAEQQHDEVFVGNYQPTLFEESEALEPGFKQRLGQ